MQIGKAAVHVNGKTLHSALDILRFFEDEDGGGKSGRKRINAQSVNTLQLQWNSVSYFFIDEISIVSCRLFAKVSSQLVTAKASSDKTLPFGGINIIVFGDFYQFPPVKGTALFADAALPRPKELQYLTISEKTNLKLVGRALFLQLDTVFFLREQMRQAGDVRYVFYSQLVYFIFTYIQLDFINCCSA